MIHKVRVKKPNKFVFFPALVTLENGNQVDDAVAKLNGKEFKDNTVTVKLGYSNQLICIAHIPCSYTDAQFLNMCQKYGAVEYSYIMRSEETGTFYFIIYLPV